MFLILYLYAEAGFTQQCGAEYLLAESIGDQYLLFWVSDRFHRQWTGFEIDVVMAANVEATITHVPKIGIPRWNEADIPWYLMIFSAGAYISFRCKPANKSPVLLIALALTSVLYIVFSRDVLKENGNGPTPAQNAQS